MAHFHFRLLSIVLCASACLPLLAHTQSSQSVASEADASQLKTTLSGVGLGDWSFNGFEAVHSTNPRDAPWWPFITQKDGDVAMFINRRKEVPNTGKGGGEQGTRHPEFALWIFRVSGPATVQEINAGITQHQMLQQSIPSLLGANHAYVLVGVGDLDEGANQVAALARALGIPLNRGH